MIRAFVAVELEDPLRQALAQVQAALRSRLRQAAGSDIRVQWVKPDSTHLTLKFLGDVPEELLPGIQRVLARTAGGHARFRVAVEGLGAFPDMRAPRVLWVGITSDAGALARLAADVESTLAAIGFAPEPRPFHPHLTLARIKERARDVGRALTQGGAPAQDVKLGVLTVAAVSLIQSELRPTGAVYTKLCEISLRAAS